MSSASTPRTCCAEARCAASCPVMACHATREPTPRYTTRSHGSPFFTLPHHPAPRSPSPSTNSKKCTTCPCLLSRGDMKPDRHSTAPSSRRPELESYRLPRAGTRSICTRTPTTNADPAHNNPSCDRTINNWRKSRRLSEDICSSSVPAMAQQTQLAAPARSLNRSLQKCALVKPQQYCTLAGNFWGVSTRGKGPTQSHLAHGTRQPRKWPSGPLRPDSMQSYFTQIALVRDKCWCRDLVSMDFSMH